MVLSHAQHHAKVLQVVVRALRCVANSGGSQFSGLYKLNKSRTIKKIYMKGEPHSI